MSPSVVCGVMESAPGKPYTPVEGAPTPEGMKDCYKFFIIAL
jgi:hypothetical protein